MSYYHKIRVLRPWQLARVIARGICVLLKILTPTKKWKGGQRAQNILVTRT